jgi:hypothetical protein
MTRCLRCGMGERAGEHDWKTGISKRTSPPHKFENNNQSDDENEFGFKDKFVSNKHKKERYQ